MRSITIMLWTIVLTGSCIAGPVYTTYLWHMQQPIYWPDNSQWSSGRYQKVYESLSLKQSGGNQYAGSEGSHPFNDLDTIFNNDDRVADYNYYPHNTLAAIGDIADSGAQVSFGACLIENVSSLAEAGWQGGRYPGNWAQNYREAALWTTSGGKPRLDLVGVSAHHSIAALIDPEALRMELRVQKAARQWLWPSIPETHGFFPAEICFSERIIPILVQEGYSWVLVPNIHISRACSDYPYDPMCDKIDPPNAADQINPAGGTYFRLTISRGITCTDAVPLAYRPHNLESVDPNTGLVYRIIGVPAEQGMSWDEGYGSYGFGDIDQVAGASTTENPELIVFAHDGDNAYSGGYSYFNENVPAFCHQAAARGDHPTTVEQFLASHAPAANDVVHVEDGGWVNADGDFGSPQYINWNWPLVNAAGQFDIPNGWAEDERNWAVITAAHSYVETAEQIAGPSRPQYIFRPEDGATETERAWHFYLASLESGYMYYGTSLDMEVKPTLACNQAIDHAQNVIGSGEQDHTGPAIWIPQRLPWNPGGKGMGSLWHWQYTDMTSDFYVWTFVHDPSSVARVSFFIRQDGDGVNPLNDYDNETYEGGPGVGAWTEMTMNQRDFPAGNLFSNPDINFFVTPTQIADEYWVQVTGYANVLLDYYVEAEDGRGNVKRSPIQHVYVGQFVPQGVTWSPLNPSIADVIRITINNPGQGGWLHWGVNAQGSVWETPNQAYWPTGTSLFQGGPAVESPLLGPDGQQNYYIDLGPFNNPVQAVQSVDFVIHYQDDTWDNNGGADYHIPISQNTPVPSATPTPSPATTLTSTPAHTATRTPTPNPEASPTPTRIPGAVAIELQLNAPWFRAGDWFELTCTASNDGSMAVDCTEWVALQVFDAYYFYPAWDEVAAGLPLTLSAGQTTPQQILAFPLPTDLPPSGPFYFYAALTRSASFELLCDPDSVVFGFY